LRETHLVHISTYSGYGFRSIPALLLLPNIKIIALSAQAVIPTQERVKASEGLVGYLSTNLEKVRNNPHPLHYPAPQIIIPVPVSPGSDLANSLNLKKINSKRSHFPNLNLHFWGQNQAHKQYFLRPKAFFSVKNPNLMQNNLPL